MLIGVHQPAYFPWLGLMEKIALSEKFVVLDNVQYNARAFQHRTLYSRSTGATYLSLSVQSKNHQVNAVEIRDIMLADASVPRNHFKTLLHRYGKRPGWRLVAADLEEILQSPPARLLDLNLAIMRLTMRELGIATELILGSDLKAAGVKSALMLSVVKAAGGNAYLCGSGARDYMVPEDFEEAGVKLYWQSFSHPQYAQSHSAPFQPGCFALEWVIEEPETAKEKFLAHVRDATRRIGGAS